MQDIGKRIEAIEKEIRETPYHKGTEHHIGILRARLTKLKDQVVDGQTRRRQGSGGSSGFALRKHGDATLVLVGFPSVGKSTLLNKLTNARSPVAPYEFTTVTVIPGMMKYKGANIQILDVPGLIEGASSGKGRGLEVLSVTRSADLLLLLVEAGKEKQFNLLNRELRLNEVSVPVIRVVNKIDLARGTRSPHEASAMWGDTLPVSAEEGIGLDRLREEIWEKLKLVRVYLRRPDGTVEKDEPMIIREGQTLKDVAGNVGTEFAHEHKEAKIWGPGARFPGQRVSLTVAIRDGMEVMFL